MKIPAPPLYTAPGHADSSSRVDEGVNQDNSNFAYRGYNGSLHSQNSSTSPNNEEQAAVSHHHTAAAHQFQQQQLSGHQYHDYYRTSQTIYDPNYDQQYTQRVEESHDQSYGQKSEQTQEESSNEEVIAPSTPSSSIKEKLLPNVFSLAQKLLPTVMKRLYQHESLRIDYDDDFAGHCSPLGSPRPTKSPRSSLDQSADISHDSLKTTGLEESDYGNNYNHDEGDDVEAGGDPMDEITEYLPQSAALLISALQSSARKVTKYDGGSLATSESVQDFFNRPLKQRSNTLEMEIGEKEADALLESIRNDDLGGSKRDVTQGSASRRGSEGPQDGTGASSTSAVAVGGDATTSFDDDDSIGGDMARLTRSIASIQRDLQNVDFSHLEDIHNDGFGDVGFGLDEYDGENSLVARFKLWFSRGMIMEQKLLQTYVTPDGRNNGDDGTTTAAGANATGRYVDNPVLVWSLALMWSFVVLILMHPKIAELVEGRSDAGQLADIIEWLFS